MLQNLIIPAPKATGCVKRMIIFGTEKIILPANQKTIAVDTREEIKLYDNDAFGPPCHVWPAAPAPAPKPEPKTYARQEIKKG